MLKIIEAMYSHMVNIVHLNGELSKEFVSKNGVKQGDNFSPMGFNSYIDNMITEIKNLNLGAELKNGKKVSILAYVDDVVLIAKSTEELQTILNKVSEWCKKWGFLSTQQKLRLYFLGKKLLPKLKQNFMLTVHY